MFDVGFLELIVIGVIALIVLGPERLPKAAHTLGRWLSRARQSFNAIKLEIDRELKVQEMQQKLQEEKRHLEQTISLDSLQSTTADDKKTHD